MDTKSYLVRDMSASDRQAIEHLVGQPLSDDQRMVIRVAPVSSDFGANPTKGDAGKSTTVPLGWRVFEGMSYEQLNRLDETLAQRPAFSRPSE